jgi:DNA-binding NtrC family response regulator
MKILLIDDDRDNLSLLGGLLSIKGFSLKVFDSPEKALEAYKSEGFDVVITDMQMPKINGLGVLKAVRTFNPRACVIILSGTADGNQVEEAMNNGAYGFYRKPLHDVEGFAETLSKIERRINSVRADTSLNGSTL